ncbi:cytochrome c [Roseiarcaceae bacterium H3SJ34-1]|uniref:c-type cytochrome n=1 Tax=Terripilifer ovatus TaxID=3032367 RepID=UPI003AB9A047|nr:cytochrome c [Roseiarcaceae bacterium H3SJ34-1]
MFGRLGFTLAAFLSLQIGHAAAEELSPGEYLARASNCIACHTATDGKPYAGGLRMATPVGDIFTTNITPDRETGIGDYTLADFDRAVRGGVTKDGRRLFPAMPYPSYAKMNDSDVAALYDFFIKAVTPVRQANVVSSLGWPWNTRLPMMVWNSVSVEWGTYREKSARDAEWNRGAYLVQGPGHCGACHTPRNLMFTEKGYDESSFAYLSGGNLDNWSAPNLTSDANTGLGRWSEDDIADYLKSGRNRHATAFGTMREVIDYSMQYLTDADRRAIAKYLKSLPGMNDTGKPIWAYDGRAQAALDKGETGIAGAAGYLRQCASCHGKDGRGVMDAPPLAGNPVVLDPDAASLVNIVLNGSKALAIGAPPRTPTMPQFRTFMDDRQIADVVSFMRRSFGNDAASIAPSQVAQMRKDTDVESGRHIILRMR